MFAKFTWLDMPSTLQKINKLSCFKALNLGIMQRHKTTECSDVTFFVHILTKIPSHFSGSTSTCQTKVDLCLIIDSSGSVRDNNPLDGSHDNWQLQLEFFSNLLKNFTIGQNDTRVAAIVFSEEVNLVFPLNRFNTLSEVQQAILAVTCLGQTTNTPEAFRVADTECFSAANGDRDDADNVIIIATDGVPFPPFRRNTALAEARRLKEKGIKIAAVGITPAIDDEFLSGISSGNNHFPVTEFAELQDVKDPLLNQLCQEEGEFESAPSLLKRHILPSRPCFCFEQGKISSQIIQKFLVFFLYGAQSSAPI